MKLYLLIKDNVIIDTFKCLNINIARAEFKRRNDTQECLIGKIENYYRVG